MSELTPHWVEKKATYRRRKHPVQKPWGGAENGLFCWTGSLARWLEHSRERVFSYKSNQRWGSDLGMSFFFFLKKALDIATWESLDARARTSEIGDAFKLWNWRHKEHGDVDLSRHWNWQHPTVQILRFMMYLWFQQDPIPSRWGGPLCSHFTYEKAKFMWDTAAQHAHVARKRWCWNWDLSVVPLCSLLFQDAQTSESRPIIGNLPCWK